MSRPPSCARPTISSLRKMNRTFSLNNVSEPTNATPTTAPPPPAIAALAMTQAGSSASSVSTPTTNGQTRLILPLTQASLALQNAAITTAKYASSNYLNHIESGPTMSIQTPQQTRTTPRRRQPRNAEEFLIAAGIVDTEQFLRKGYYVGSMVNLNDFSASGVGKSSVVVDQQNAQQSSSSSSSMNGGNTGSLKRRNSIHETSGEATTTTKSYYHRQPAAYSKMRSMTTAIVPSQEESQSSAPVSSDSSSSPTPSTQKQPAKLGPLMSACSAISPRSASHDFDEYEFLERNFNAHHSVKKPTIDANNTTTTTTNTNVTDYYTDESNSCHNEDYQPNMKNGSQFILSEQKFRVYAQTLNGLVESSHTSGSGGGGKQTPVSNNQAPNSQVAATTNWEHTSLASTNSLFSGLYIYKYLKGKKSRSFSRQLNDYTLSSIYLLVIKSLAS